MLGALIGLVSFAAFPLLGADDGRFCVAVGEHQDLVISGSGGQPIADVSGETVGKNITVGTTNLQVSYGRDATGEFTAVLTSRDQDSVALHFSAGGKSIDAEKAVVTLTFSPDLKGVLVDPGYVGTVEVDSHVLRARSLADDLPVPAAMAYAPSDVVAPNLPPSLTTPSATGPQASTPTAESAASATTQTVTPVAAPDATVAQNAPASVTPVAATTSSTSLASPAAKPETAPSASVSAPHAPALLASQLAPILPPTGNAAANSPAPAYESVQQRLLNSAPVVASGSTTLQKLYWSEPITAPDGSAPAVATDEIRLVEVHGTVTIIAQDGAEQTGSEGTLVPSGATVRTAANSSAALFMGGVNSARLMPNCELVVTQTLAGPVRTDVVNLKSGAVFSRIGHRDGETENYSVVTPEGVTGAESNDMLAFRGTPADVRGNPATAAKIDLDVTRLLAWNPAPTHGLISDVPGWNLANLDPSNQGNSGKSAPNTYFYYCPGGSVQSDDIRHEVLCGNGNGNDQGHDQGNGDGFGRGNGNGFGQGNGNGFGQGHGDGFGHGNGNDFGRGNGDGHSNHGGGSGDCQPQQVLQQILETLQPYNTKLKSVLTAIDNGTATPAEKKFYQKLTSVFFCIQEPGIVNQFEHDRKQFDKDSGIYNKILTQDLKEFGLDCLTPH
jgi:hypothetical protein